MMQGVNIFRSSKCCLFEASSATFCFDQYISNVTKTAASEFQGVEVYRR
jgi:hypothetical protein